jgi:hypothetical protein
MFPLPFFFFFFVPPPLKTFFSPAVACSGAGLGAAASGHEEMRKSGFRAKKVVGPPPENGMNLVRLAELAVLLQSARLTPCPAS